MTYQVIQCGIGPLTARPAKNPPCFFWFNTVAPFDLSIYDDASTSWVTYAPGFSAVVLPLDEIVFGTGVGVNSSPNAKFATATAILEAKDLAGNPMLLNDGTNRLFIINDENNKAELFANANAATRTVGTVDENSKPIEITDTRAAARQIDFDDEAGHRLLRMILLAATRTATISDETTVAIRAFNAVAATRTITTVDAANKTMDVVNTVAATRSVDYVDEAGDQVFFIKLTAAAKALTVGKSAAAPHVLFDVKNNKVQYVDAAAVVRGEVDLATGSPLTFANIGAAGVGNDGQGPVWIQSVRKPTEGGGAGTGMPCFYSAAGPGGAGWYATTGVLATE